MSIQNHRHWILICWIMIQALKQKLRKIKVHRNLTYFGVTFRPIRILSHRPPALSWKRGSVPSGTVRYLTIKPRPGVLQRNLLPRAFLNRLLCEVAAKSTLHSAHLPNVPVSQSWINNLRIAHNDVECAFSIQVWLCHYCSTNTRKTFKDETKTCKP